MIDIGGNDDIPHRREQVAQTNDNDGDRPFFHALLCPDIIQLIRVVDLVGKMKLENVIEFMAQNRLVDHDFPTNNGAVNINLIVSGGIGKHR